MNKEQVHQHAINLMSEGYNAGRYAVRLGEERSWFDEARRLIDEEHAKAQAFDEIKISYYMHIPNDMIGFAKQTEQTILRYKESEDE